MHMMSRQIINHREQYVYNQILKDIFCDKDIERDLAWLEYWDHANMNIFFEETMPIWILMTIGGGLQSSSQSFKLLWQIIASVRLGLVPSHVVEVLRILLLLETNVVEG